MEDEATGENRESVTYVHPLTLVQVYDKEAPTQGRGEVDAGAQIGERNPGPQER